MVVLSLFDKTGNMVKPWAKSGYRCICVDIQHNSGVVKKDGVEYWGVDVRKVQLPRVDYKIVFAFPPCDHLSISGARWFQSKGLRSLESAIDLVATALELIEFTRCKKWMLENPVSTLSTYWRKPDHIFHPHQYGGYQGGSGDSYTKKTCLWTSPGFVMPPPRSIDPVDGSKMHLLVPSDDRKDLRSQTPRGFSQAVYEYNNGIKQPPIKKTNNDQLELFNV